MSDYKPDRGRLPADCCEHLCTKTMYMASEDGDLDRYEEFEDADTASFWCVFTQTAFGPDDQAVEPESCRPGRTCCVPRLKVPEA